MTGVLIKRGNLYTERCIEVRQCEETQEENIHLQAKERNLEKILSSQPSKSTNPADTLILDF